MSHLTSKTKVVYVAMLYDEYSNYVGEGGDRDTMEGAICDGEEMVSDLVEKTDKYHFAEIKTKILPVWW